MMRLCVFQKTIVLVYRIYATKIGEQIRLPLVNCIKQVSKDCASEILRNFVKSQLS